MGHRIGGCRGAGVACDFYPPRLYRILLDEVVFHGGIENLIKYHPGLVFGGLGSFHVIKKGLYVVGSDVLYCQTVKGGENMKGKLALVGGGCSRLHIGLGIGVVPVPGVSVKGVLPGLLGHPYQLDHLICKLLHGVGSYPPLYAVDKDGLIDFCHVCINRRKFGITHIAYTVFKVPDCGFQTDHF